MKIKNKFCVGGSKNRKWVKLIKMYGLTNVICRVALEAETKLWKFAYNFLSCEIQEYYSQNSKSNRWNFKFVITLEFKY